MERQLRFYINYCPEPIENRWWWQIVKVLLYPIGPYINVIGHYSSIIHQRIIYRHPTLEEWSS